MGPTQPSPSPCVACIATLNPGRGLDTSLVVVVPRPGLAATEHLEDSLAGQPLTRPDLVQSVSQHRAYSLLRDTHLGGEGGQWEGRYLAQLPNPDMGTASVHRQREGA